MSVSYNGLSKPLNQSSHTWDVNGITESARQKEKEGEEGCFPPTVRYFHAVNQPNNASRLSPSILYRPRPAPFPCRQGNCEDGPAKPTSLFLPLPKELHSERARGAILNVRKEIQGVRLSSTTVPWQERAPEGSDAARRSMRSSAHTHPRKGGTR